MRVDMTRGGAPGGASRQASRVGRRSTGRSPGRAWTRDAVDGSRAPPGVVVFRRTVSALDVSRSPRGPPHRSRSHRAQASRCACIGQPHPPPLEKTRLSL
jgi:hypothetical protein